MVPVQCCALRAPLINQQWIVCQANCPPLCHLPLDVVSPLLCLPCAAPASVSMKISVQSCHRLNTLWAIVSKVRLQCYELQPGESLASPHRNPVLSAW